MADWGFQHNALHAYSGRGAFASQSYGRTAGGYGGLGNGYNGNRGQRVSRPPEASNWLGNSWRGNSNSSFPAYGGGYRRTPPLAYNHVLASESRQQFDHGSRPDHGFVYGSSLNRRAGEGYRSGSAAAYDRSMHAYRAPNSGFPRGEFGGPSSRAFASRDFAHSAAKMPHSGDFSRRGSGVFHMERSVHAPKSFHDGGKHFGGGHSHGGGGGHSRGHGGGKHRG